MKRQSPFRISASKSFTLPPTGIAVKLSSQNIQKKIDILMENKNLIKKLADIQHRKLKPVFSFYC